jgi:hypothetical protein
MFKVLLTITVCAEKEPKALGMAVFVAELARMTGLISPSSNYILISFMPDSHNSGLKYSVKRDKNLYDRTYGPGG